MLQDPYGWRVVDWPSWREVARGDGRAFPEPGGDRIAVLDAQRRVRVEGGPGPAPPPAAGPVRTLAWAGAKALLAVTGTHALQSSFNPGPTLLPVPEQGVSAQRFGAYPVEGMALWHVPMRGEPQRSAVGTGIEDLSRPVSLGADGVAFSLYRYPAFGTPCVQRIRRVRRNGGPPLDLFPDLPGSTTGLVPSPDGRRLAFLHSDLVPFFPFWYRLAVADRSGAVVYPLPHTLRLTGEPPVWSPDGGWVAVTAFDGIRVGIVTADIEVPGAWHWLCAASGACRAVALAAGGQEALAVCESPGVPAALHRVEGQGYFPLEAPPVADAAARFRLLRWSVGDADFEGLLAVPAAGGPPWPLVVDLHGGPVNGLTAGRNDRLLRWCAAGFACWAPDYRSSGIAGRVEMEAAFRGGAVSPGGTDSADILAGVDTVVRERVLDPARLYLFGSSFWGLAGQRHHHPRQPVPRRGGVGGRCRRAADLPPRLGRGRLRVPAMLPRRQPVAGARTVRRGLPQSRARRGCARRYCCSTATTTVPRRSAGTPPSVNTAPRPNSSSIAVKGMGWCDRTMRRTCTRARSRGFWGIEAGDHRGRTA